MPFIVFFFISLLIIYIPLPTLILMFNRLAQEHDTTAMLLKILLSVLVIIDYKVSFYWIYNCKVKKRYYIFLVLLNLLEFSIHLFLRLQYESINLSIICSSQILLLSCMILFLLSRKFRSYIFEPGVK
ncbi:hypothetical protein [Enterococcus faecium]|uniref:hypothetical protein n=1 Tax=Enterococcus faecium TaxID=1352 RepID=UPI000A32DFE0|nr:hypothetical protein [Enterococcus faecium]OTN91488.1 hypothetical protein A5809_000853 [Enterococcus faecium]